MQFFDAHFHVIDPHFPLIANQGYLPPFYTTRDYLSAIGGMGLEPAGGAVVTASFQGFDQTYLLQALKVLGNSYAGVTQLPFETTDQEIRNLHAGGVRALRFNVKRGGSENLARMREMAERAHDLAGWHAEIYIDAKEIDDSLAAVLLSMPRVSIDHLGLSGAGLPRLLQLAEKGVHVKATGFGRVDFDVRSALRALASANPDALMFGTDLPSTRAAVPFSRRDVDLLLEILEGELLRKVLVGNAAALYKIELPSA